jgi:hypothetical protein
VCAVRGSLDFAFSWAVSNNSGSVVAVDDVMDVMDVTVDMRLYS